jgi:chromosome segregation ATPase
MSNEAYEFRNATFGGFNRDDVTLYIKNMNDQHNASMAEVQAQLDTLTQQNTTLATQVAQYGTIQQKATELASQLAAEQKENVHLREQNSALQAQVAQLKQQQSALQEKLKTWAPSVTTYGAIKNQMAEIELNARERSALLLQKAEDQAAEKRRQSDSTLAHTAAEYDKVRADTNQTLSYLAGQLQHIQGQLQSLSVVLDKDGATLFGLQTPAEPEAVADAGEENV